jgi:hypothetical protein
MTVKPSETAGEDAPLGVGLALENLDFGQGSHHGGRQPRNLVSHG